MMRRAAGVAAVALAMALGGLTRTASASPSSSDDRDIANRAVLTIDDVPSGYRQGSVPSSAQPPNNRACRTYRPEYRRARGQAEARSHTFEQGNGQAVANHVTVWSDEAGATGFMRVVSNDSMAACLKAVISPIVENSLKKNATRYDKLDVAVGRESSPPIGDDQVSYQAKFTVHQGSTSVSIYVDYQLVRMSRAVTVFEFINTFTPFDQSERSNIVGTGVSRLSSALGLPVSTSTT
jgi:hypothetical protein